MTSAPARMASSVSGRRCVETRVTRQLEHTLALPLQLCEISVFVLIALPPDELTLRVVDKRPVDLASRVPDFERSKMRAGEVVRQIRRRELKRTILGELQDIFSIAACQAANSTRRVWSRTRWSLFSWRSSVSMRDAFAEPGAS